MAKDRDDELNKQEPGQEEFSLEEILAAKEAGPDALEGLLLPVERVFEPLPLLKVSPAWPGPWRRTWRRR